MNSSSGSVSARASSAGPSNSGVGRVLRRRNPPFAGVAGVPTWRVTPAANPPYGLGRGFDVTRRSIGMNSSSGSVSARASSAGPSNSGVGRVLRRRNPPFAGVAGVPTWRVTPAANPPYGLRRGFDVTRRSIGMNSSSGSVSARASSAGPSNSGVGRVSRRRNPPFAGVAGVPTWRVTPAANPPYGLGRGFDITRRSIGMNWSSGSVSARASNSGVGRVSRRRNPPFAGVAGVPTWRVTPADNPPCRLRRGFDITRRSIGMNSSSGSVSARASNSGVGRVSRRRNPPFAGVAGVPTWRVTPAAHPPYGLGRGFDITRRSIGMNWSSGSVSAFASNAGPSNSSQNSAVRS